MERVIAHHPDEADIWKRVEPKYRVRLDEPFTPFAVEDFAGRDLWALDFYVSLSFTLEGFGVGSVGYQRDRLLGFNPGWAEENATTPFGPATLAYRFRLGLEVEGVIIPPLELAILLFGRIDRYPPDQLLAFPSFGRAILGRWERRVHDPELHALPLVISRQYLLPEWRESRAFYLPEDPRVLSDLTVTFLATEPKRASESK